MAIRAATRGRKRAAAAVAVAAVEVIARCDELLRQVPRPEEPWQVARLRGILGRNADFQVDQIQPGPLWVVYISSVIDRQRLVDHVFARWSSSANAAEPSPSRVWSHATTVPTVHLAADLLVTGEVAVIDGHAMWGIDVSGIPQRAIPEPSTERSVMGPKEAFNERIQTGAALLRHRLPTPTLALEEVRVGRRSRTRVMVAYLSDVVRPGLVTWTLRALRGIQTDMIRDSRQVQAYLIGQRWSVFPLIERSERPDRVATALTAGRLAVLVDGSPLAMLLPTTIWEEHHDEESALDGPLVAAYVRSLRKLGGFAATVAPGFYVAVLTTNVGVLWPSLALITLQTRTGVPYPVVTETLLMLIVVDVLAQATVQAPKGVGDTLSIVGTLIVGQISVQAHLASQLLMIVIAGSALGSFLTLKYAFSYGLRLTKYVFVLFAAVGGLFGWTLALSMTLLHLADLRSAGLPYVAPAAPMMPRTFAADFAADLPEPRATHRPTHYHSRDATSKPEEE